MQLWMLLTWMDVLWLLFGGLVYWAGVKRGRRMEQQEQALIAKLVKKVIEAGHKF